MAMGRPRAFNKDKALDRALDVFWRKGYEGATLCDLTSAMGINPPSLYAAFGNKEGLFRQALDRYSQISTAYWAQALEAPTARGVAEALLRGTAKFLTDSCHPKGCLAVQGALACGADAECIRNELADRRATSQASHQRPVETGEERRRPPRRRRPSGTRPLPRYRDRGHGGSSRERRQPQRA